MSSQQFVSSNNQSLLWKVINNTPQTINYFAGAPPGEKEKWFQYIIGQIYNQYRGQNLSLKDMNKRAIDAMLQTLSPSVPLQTKSTFQSGPSQTNSPYQSAPSVPYQSTPYQSAPSATKSPMPVVRTKEQTLNDQFSRRQAEYDLMTKKETPTPHFTENVKDEAILDLNSAVEAYRRNRNEDVDVILPQPPSANDKSLQSDKSLVSDKSLDKPLTLKLNLKDAQPISLSVEEELPKKVVQWGDNIEHVFDNNNSIIQNNIETKLDAIEKDIQDIKSKLVEILSLLQK
jgi:hypothetical protein